MTQNEVERLQKSLADFIAAPESRVIAVNGRSGRGKTYQLNKIVRESVAAFPESVPAYSYVSLFGLDDLDSVRDAIFFSAVPTNELGSVTTPTNVRRPNDKLSVTDRTMERLRAAGMRIYRKYSDATQEFPWLKDYAPFLRTLAVNSVQRYVVCIDDLERHSRNLDLKDILGLISALKERNDCRVVVILHSDVMSPEDEKTYNAMREKVFDYEVAYNPSAAENVVIVFNEQTPTYSLARQFASHLNIANIRVLLRIKRSLDAILEIARGQSEAVLQQIVHSTTLLVWSFNSSAEEAPAFSYLKLLSYGNFMDLDPKKKPSEQQSNWNTLLKDYEYLYSDEIDLAICRLIETGFVDGLRLRQVLVKRELELERAAAEAKFSAAWDCYHHGFGDDTQELTNMFREAVDVGSQWISLGNINATVELFRQLNDDATADWIVDKWVAMHGERGGAIFDPANNPFYPAKVDTRLLNSIVQATPKQQTKDQLKDVVARLSKSNSWSERDMEVLKSASPDDYFQLFTSALSAESTSYVKACLQFAKFGDPIHAGISDNAKVALRRIAASSPLNKMRAESFGVTSEVAAPDTSVP